VISYIYKSWGKAFTFRHKRFLCQKEGHTAVYTHAFWLW
jgi:hypothetical protein